MLFRSRVPSVRAFRRAVLFAAESRPRLVSIIFLSSTTFTLDFHSSTILTPGSRVSIFPETTKSSRFCSGSYPHGNIEIPGCVFFNGFGCPGHPYPRLSIQEIHAQDGSNVSPGQLWPLGFQWVPVRHRPIPERGFEVSDYTWVCHRRLTISGVCARGR